MTDRVNYLVVALETPTRVDDAQDLIGAIRQLRNVAAVSPEMTNPDLWVAERRVKNEIAGKVMDILLPND